jgi:hypothetical protein
MSVFSAMFGRGENMQSNTRAKTALAATAAPSGSGATPRTPAPSSPVTGRTPASAGSRTRPPTSPVIGRAVPRVGPDPAPPEIGPPGEAANTAATRARRRGVGANVLTGIKSVTPSGAPVLKRRTLLGGQ